MELESSPEEEADYGDSPSPVQVSNGVPVEEEAAAREGDVPEEKEGKQPLARVELQKVQVKKKNLSERRREKLLRDRKGIQTQSQVAHLRG